MNFFSTMAFSWYLTRRDQSVRLRRMQLKQGLTMRMLILIITRKSKYYIKGMIAWRPPSIMMPSPKGQFNCPLVISLSVRCTCGSYLSTLFPFGVSQNFSLKMLLRLRLRVVHGLFFCFSVAITFLL